MEPIIQSFFVNICPVKGRRLLPYLSTTSKGLGRKCGKTQFTQSFCISKQTAHSTVTVGHNIKQIETTG